MEQTNEIIMELLSRMTAKPDTAQILVTLLAALGLSILMWAAYRLANTAASYQNKFAVTLITLALLSTLLMDLVQSNLSLSLGMLGSLSIVRFRTTIKDPRDIGFIFWAMAIGLASSTGSYLTGLVGSVIVAVCMIVTARRGEPDQEMLLVVRGSKTNLDSIGRIVEAGGGRCQMKAKNVMSDSFELVYEICAPVRESNTLIRNLFELDGIDTVNLLAEARHV